MLSLNNGAMTSSLKCQFSLTSLLKYLERGIVFRASLAAMAR